MSTEETPEYINDDLRTDQSPMKIGLHDWGSKSESQPRTYRWQDDLLIFPCQCGKSMLVTQKPEDPKPLEAIMIGFGAACCGSTILAKVWWRGDEPVVTFA